MNKKIEVFEAKLEAARLTRAAYDISRHVSNVYDEGLFEILEEYERMENRPLARVSYEKESKFCNGQKAYVVYLDPQRTDDWGLDMAFPLNNDMVSFQLVTKIRELMKLGYEIIWS